MKTYVVKEYLNNYRGFRWVTVAYNPEEKVEEHCKPPCLFEDYKSTESKIHKYEVE